MICNADFEDLLALRAEPMPWHWPGPGPHGTSGDVPRETDPPVPEWIARWEDDGGRPHAPLPLPAPLPGLTAAIRAGALVAALPMIVAFGQAAAFWAIGQGLPDDARDPAARR